VQVNYYCGNRLKTLKALNASRAQLVNILTFFQKYIANEDATAVIKIMTHVATPIFTQHADASFDIASTLYSIKCAECGGMVKE
jgi:hypothetical protein